LGDVGHGDILLYIDGNCYQYTLQQIWIFHCLKSYCNHFHISTGENIVDRTAFSREGSGENGKVND
jgi:hypothetical protein